MNQGEIARRALDIEELQRQAEALEREATAAPDDRSDLGELALALARQRRVLVVRAGELRSRSERCHWLAAREVELGAADRAGRLEAEALRLEVEAQQLDREVERLPGALLAGSRSRSEHERMERRRAGGAAWAGPERRCALASMPPWWLTASPG
jgi:hypothetical protein